jgi:hypothetical protein
MVQGSMEECCSRGLGGEYTLDADIKAKEGHDVTGSWDKASSYALWTGVSSGTGLTRDVVVASAVSVCVCFGLAFQTCVSWTSSDGQQGWDAVELVVSAPYFVA